MPALGTDAPAEEQVGRRLHQLLALDHPFAVLSVDALTGIGLQYRGVSLLELQKERGVGNRHHQGYHAQRADTADADHFDRRVDQPVAVEESTAILGQGFAVFPEARLDQIQVARAPRPLGMKNGRRSIVYAGLRTGALDQLWEHQLRAAPCGSL